MMTRGPMVTSQTPFSELEHETIVIMSRRDFGVLLTVKGFAHAISLSER